MSVDLLATKRFYQQQDGAIAEALEALMVEPLDVRMRLAERLEAIAEGIGHRDLSRMHGLLEVATLLKTGRWVPEGASW